MNQRTSLLETAKRTLCLVLALSTSSLALANETKPLFDDLPTPMSLKNNDAYLCKPYTAIYIQHDGSVLKENVGNFRLKFTNSKVDSPRITLSKEFPFHLFETDNQMYSLTSNRYDGYFLNDFFKNEFMFGDANFKLFGALEKYENYLDFKFHNFGLGIILQANCFKI